MKKYVKKYQLSEANNPNDIKEESCINQTVKIYNKEIIFGAEGPIILKEGKFWSISAKVEKGRWGKQYILVFPNLKELIEKGECFIRLDSGCMSGVLGDNTCDCIEQLRMAQNLALKKGGVIVHIPEHDGRGWGEECKMANQKIMDITKRDTIDVAKEFYQTDHIDVRTFEESALVLKALGFPKGYKFNLGTENPIKVNALLEAGFDVINKPIKINGASSRLKTNLKAKSVYFKENRNEKN